MVGKGWGDEVVRGAVGHLRRVGGVAGMIDGEDVDSAGAGEDDVLGRLGHESRRADKEDAGGIDTLLSVATPTGGNRWRGMRVASLPRPTGEAGENRRRYAWSVGLLTCVTADHRQLRVPR